MNYFLRLNSQEEDYWAKGYEHFYVTWYYCQIDFQKGCV